MTRNCLPRKAADTDLAPGHEAFLEHQSRKGRTLNLFRKVCAPDKSTREKFETFAKAQTCFAPSITRCIHPLPEEA